jgi:hypothetical protein
MTQQYIQVGTAPNDGAGDPIRTAFIKTNDNFSELYTRVQVSPPSTAIGSVGDAIGYYAPTADYFYYCFANYNGSSVIWAQIQSAGNISATKIQNGNSSIEILDTNGNANVSINGTGNVAVFANTGVYVSQLSASGNIATGNYIFGNGIYLTGLPATYSNANVAGFLTVYSGNISAEYISVTGNINSNNILNSASISAQGNILTQSTVSALGNIVTSGYFVGTFAGNVTGNFVVPGSNTQVIFNTSGNADAVGGMTYNKGSNTFAVLGVVTAQGNIIGGNILTTGVISATGAIISSNTITGSNLAAGTGYISTSGNVTGGNILFGTGVISGSGNILGANVISGALFTATGNLYGGNILTSGLISAAANIYSNATVHVTNDINVGGNISANVYTGTTISINGNITGANIFATAVSASGNITGSYFLGNGACLTGVITSVANINNGSSNISIFGPGGNVVVSVANNYNITTFTNSGILTNGIISVTGNITSGNLSTVGLISLTGNIYAGNVINAGSSSITGNVTVGNILTDGLISAAGNITSNNITSGNITANLYGVTVSASGNVTAGNLLVGNIVNSNSNGVGNIGSSSTYFNTLFAKATSAQYADLAEWYSADAYYIPGTVVSFGGPEEVTFCDIDQDPAVAGIISTNPAYVMNSSLQGEHVVAVALIGRVPCQVQGPVVKGSLMVSAGNGRARAQTNPAAGTIIGKALESFNGDVGIIEIVVGRV